MRRSARPGTTRVEPPDASAFVIGASSSPPSYRLDIDGLRAFAVLAIIALHSTSHVSGGFTGVDIFFVISGFLITGVIQRDLACGTFRLTDFYARRVRRILPALLLMLVVTLGFGALLLLPEEYVRLGRHTLAGVFLSSNLLLWKELGYFDSEAAEKPLLHLWSLGG